MAEQDVDPDMQNMINQVTERCLTALRHERAQSDQTQLEQINTLLEHWSEQSFQKTKDLVSTMTAKGNERQPQDNGAFTDATTDIRERQSNLLAVCEHPTIVNTAVHLQVFLALDCFIGCSGNTQQAVGHPPRCYR